MSDIVKNFLQTKEARDLNNFKQSLRGKDGVNGTNGINGKDGLSIKGEKGEKGEKGRDGKDGVDGRDGVDGLSVKGDKGDVGLSIINSAINGQGELVLTYSDNRVENVGRVRGYDGVNKGGSGGSGAAIKYVDEQLALLSSNAKNYRIESANYQVVQDDDYIEINTKDVIVTLPLIATLGDDCHVDNSSDGNITVDNVQGDNTLILNAGEGSYFAYNGTQWRIK